MRSATVTDRNSLDLVLAAAYRGVHEAQAIYGQMLLDGKLVDRSPVAALHWFERAARSGDSMAMNMVGRCLDQGWGTPPNQPLAEKWFRKAAERGSDWGMYNLATLLLLHGEEEGQNQVEAFYWLRKAADLGHAKSMNLLGGFYEDGWAVKQDLATARQYYRDAALGGDFRGQFNYARFLAKEGDLLGTLHWLKQVPNSATPAFMRKMKLVLAESHFPVLRDFAQSLP